MTTGAGFVSFFAFIPLILKNHMNFFWRWVALPSPPLFLLGVSCVFLPANMKDSMAAETLPTLGGCRGRGRRREGDADRERDRKRGEEGGRRGCWRDGLISTSSSYSSKPASRLQRLGRTRHVPSRAELPVCGQDFPRGARGPGQPGRQHPENNYMKPGG